MFKVFYKVLGCGVGAKQYETLESLQEGLKEIQNKFKTPEGKSLIVKLDIRENDRLIEQMEYKNYGINLNE